MTRTVRHWTTGEVRRLAEMRAGGATIPQCAAALDRTPGSVSGALVRHGLVVAHSPTAPPWRRKPGALMRVVGMYVRRYGAAEAADRLGIRRGGVYAALKRARGK